MHLHIYNLDKPKFFHEAKSVVVKTASGELTILDNHQPLIAPIIPCTIAVVDNKDKHAEFKVKGGVLEVRPGSEVNILAD
jgi:F0F1-type ATP synthase epsilon subunit